MAKAFLNQDPLGNSYRNEAIADTLIRLALSIKEGKITLNEFHHERETRAVYDLCAAADWQLEQVLEWLKTNTEDYVLEDYYSTYFLIEAFLDDFKKAMRPTTCHSCDGSTGGYYIKIETSNAPTTTGGQLMTEQHPITPPPELIAEWVTEARFQDYCSITEQVANHAAQWGADQELEACVAWLDGFDGWAAAESLRADLRPKPPSPKPPSLKEQALRAAHLEVDPEGRNGSLIIRALKALPDELEDN